MKMEATTSNNILKEAVNAVVGSFKKHSSQTDNAVDAVEALHEVWLLKQTHSVNMLNGSVQYHAVPASTPPYVCYVILPGGSCFGSFEECWTKEAAKQSAAKIALMNSILNEHPRNLIDAQTIKKMLSDASVSFPSNCLDQKTKPLDVFKQMLESHIGQSILSFQESMSIFQLLHWNGDIKAMKLRSCFRDEVIQHYSNRYIDDDMISQMVLDWVAKEKDQPSIIMKEINKAKKEILTARFGGRELRFYKEKLTILNLAHSNIIKQ